ncbi:MAG: glycoside hydrolase family 3 C-terminal domain-containing protein [Lachnospiraceae bacterium]
MKNVKEIVKQMTLEEKAAMCSGADFWHTENIERLKVTSTMVSDGPHGLRKQPEESAGDHLGLNGAMEAVCFPAACAAACSFDRELLYDMGQTLGRECRAENVSVLLGPAVNIKRSPLCGRNFEYMSEDPYVSGELAAAYINGVQSQNVGTSIKHFVANNQEHERMTISSDVDERTLREIYFPAFETAVKKAKPWTVMCSYNRVNGLHASENRWLLTDILRKEWGFDGYVMSDWGAVRDRVDGILAGLDLEMPGSNGANDRAIIEAVQTGKLPKAVLDETVERIMNIVFRYTEGDGSQTEEVSAVFDREKDHKKAREIAEKCIVLLKNDEKVLPFSKGEKIAMIGGFAENPRYQGGGSSHINSYKVVSALTLKDSYGDIAYAEGFSAKGDIIDEAKEEEALQIAKAADKIVVFAGLPDSFESESYDRSHMRLPECQNRLLGKLCELHKPVAVVLHNGSPVEMPWADQVKGIVEAYLGGEAVEEAVMDVLYGKVNPSGRLAETFPLRLEDNPSYLNFPGKNGRVNYAEGLYVGYRYYDTKKMEVLFPFGYGLSYTTYSYDGLSMDKTIADSGELRDKSKVTVSLNVTNTGNLAGREVVQLYVSDCTNAAERPEQELKGFTSVWLEPGETKRVSMELDYRSFAWYDVDRSEWYAADGSYEIRIGSSSRDILLRGEIILQGAEKKLPVIDADVMIGDLLECSETKGFVQDRLMPYIAEFVGTDDFNKMDEMERKMVYYLPLSSLRSFSEIDNDGVKKLVDELKAICSADI